MRPTAAILLVGLVGLLLIGCGGGASNNSRNAGAAASDRLSPSGYSALRNAIREGDRLRKRGPITTSALRQHRDFCVHLGTHHSNVEIQAVRSECVAEVARGLALLHLVSLKCNKRPDAAAKLACTARDFRRIGTGSQQIVTSFGHIITRLQPGPCRSYAEFGVSENQRLATASKRMVSALHAGKDVQGQLAEWNAAFDAVKRMERIDAANHDTRVLVCKPR